MKARPYEINDDDDDDDIESGWTVFEAASLVPRGVEGPTERAASRDDPIVGFVVGGLWTIFVLWYAVTNN